MWGCEWQSSILVAKKLMQEGRRVNLMTWMCVLETHFSLPARLLFFHCLLFLFCIGGTKVMTWLQKSKTLLWVLHAVELKWNVFTAEKGGVRVNLVIFTPTFQETTRPNSKITRAVKSLTIFLRSMSRVWLRKKLNTTYRTKKTYK